MQQINTPDGLFHDGNPATGELGSIVTAAWLNAVQGELKNLVIGLGGALDVTKDDQIKTLLMALLALKAPLASPVLTGTPTAPTAAPGTNNLQLANTAFVQAAIAALVGSSPAALDTLYELAAAFGNDANFATTMTNALALKAPLANPALTGNPTAPTPAQFDNDTSLATTEFVQRSQGNYSDVVVISANTTLTAAHAGKYIIGSGTITLTLPDPATLPKGVAFHIEAGAAAVVTVATQNANTIDGPNLPSASSSFVLRGNTSSEFIAYSTTQFRAVSGSGASSLAANGYQKLPSGLIIQWGAQQVPNATNQTYSFPLTWPNGCLVMTCSHHGADRTVNSICAVQSLSTFWLGHTYASSAQVNWHAFGY